MKILFVCTCLEPGFDGVGDYTWRLAVELAQRGHECSIIALTDHYVQEPVFSTRTLYADTDEGIACLRLPAGGSWSDRVARAAKMVASVGPDWISWQFVLYGFDPRGIGFGLGGKLREIAGGRPSQVMFHEIWLGESAGASFKERALGALQKRAVRDVLQKLRPEVVHTHTPLYQLLLGELGVQAAALPLFGNIPLMPYPHPDWLMSVAQDYGGGLELADRATWWVFVLFGSIHPEWDANDFREKATAAARAAGRKCVFISIGRPGAAGEEILQQMRAHESEAWRVLVLGPQPEEEVSQCLFSADFGVSPVPPECLPKSGTTAAMIEHGLWVVATRPPTVYPEYPAEKLVDGLRNVVRDFNVEGLEKTEPGSLLPQVADRFIESLARPGVKA